MKKRLVIFTFVIYTCFVFCEEPRPWLSKDIQKAYREGAITLFTVHVKDEFGNAVSNATLSIGYFPPKAKNYARTQYLSNEAGQAVVNLKTIEPAGGMVSKEGYYNTHFMFIAGDPENPWDTYSKVKDGKWLPWNPTISVVLRKMQNPIPMYASFAGRGGKGLEFFQIPLDKEIGFDCQKNAFVAPHGECEITDFLVRLSSLPLSNEMKKEMSAAKSKIDTATNSLQRAKFLMDYRAFNGRNYEINLRVPDPEGGFIRKIKRKDSTFISDHEAPTNGYTNVFHSSMGDKFNPKFDSPTDLSEEEYFIFRSRVIRNEHGEIVSANFGKIYGPIKYGIDRDKNVGGMTFNCYFNPVPNNRSIEFDGKNNLFFPQYKTSNFIP